MILKFLNKFSHSIVIIEIYIDVYYMLVYKKASELNKEIE